ncbi:hypothetical protein [Kibdelosporangium philippinense]
MTTNPQTTLIQRPPSQIFLWAALAKGAPGTGTFVRHAQRKPGSAE